MQMKEALLSALKKRGTTPAQFLKDCKAQKPKPVPVTKRSKPS